VRLAAITAVFAVCAGMIFACISPVYFYRMIRWWQWDVSDYSSIPSLEIQTSTPSSQFSRNLDPLLVSTLFEKNIEVENLEKFLINTNTTSFIVIQDNTVLYESYPLGAPYKDGYHSFSVAKSFISALVGIAIDEGTIDGVDDPITKYLPELKARDQRFQNITIAHLLTMSSGLQYTCPYCDFGIQVPWGDNVKSLASPDLRNVLLTETHIIDDPGSHYLYKAYDPQLLSLIIERATGRPASIYLQEKIWKPIHMEQAATWLVDSKKSGLIRGDLGLNSLPIDLAKFGRLFLDQGNWDGQQIISSDWIINSIHPGITQPEGYYPSGTEIPNLEASLFPNGDGNIYYGYLWWIASRENNSNDFWALGRLGQWIYISPAKNLIIVRTGLGNGENINITTSTWLRMFYQFASDL
jgi:CubicO group peptidase (beta-lactamase class C family)